MSVYIIAEAGVNHNGSYELAEKLIDEAVAAGCDAVKFQTFKAKNLVTKAADMAAYQIENIGQQSSQYDMLKKLEISFADFKRLYAYCSEKGIEFLSTPFDEESVDFLDQIGMKQFKVSSGDLTNKQLIKRIARVGKPVILSTGMAVLGEIEDALSWIYEEKNDQVTVLHCTSDYPAPFDEVNLSAMQTMRLAFRCPVGYSDHTLGIEIPIAAAALGAEVIEKHFTLDRSMEGPDHKASLEPHELKKMVESIRNVEKAIGTGIKKPSIKELETKKVARKSLVAKCNISKGMLITEDMLCVKRPGNGIPSKEIENIVGRKAKLDLFVDHVIQYTDFE